MIEVLSLGGSLVCPEEIDVLFLKKFRNFILKWTKRKKFLIFVGGGKIARKYQKVAREFQVKNEELDWVGIFATFLNAQLLKAIFKNLAFQKIISNPLEKVKTKKKIIIFGGWKPGRSTDFDAVLAAKNFGAKRVINLSNIDFVFDKDPTKFKDAKPLKKVSFNELFKIVGKKWTPGANLPFDPEAVKLAKKEKIKVIFLNGRNFKNLEKVFLNKKFKGTVIE
jgi:uridylate kinase